MDKSIESDPARLRTREKQLEYGMQTQGYLNDIAAVPKTKRKPTDPKTPNKYQGCSKRSWDGQVRKWRRDLHAWDDVDASSISDTSEVTDSSLEDLNLDSLSLDGTSADSFEEEVAAAFSEDAELIPGF